MKSLRWLLLGQSAVVYVLVFEEAWFGDPIRWGVIVVGLAITFAGIFMAAVWNDPIKGDQR